MVDKLSDVALTAMIVTQGVKHLALKRFRAGNFNNPFVPDFLWGKEPVFVGKRCMLRESLHELFAQELRRLYQESYEY